MSPPRVSGPNGVLENEHLKVNLNNQNPTKVSEKEFKTEIVWRNVAIFVILHLGAIYGLYLSIFYAQWTTILLAYLFNRLGGLGITAGVHRLWSHRCYKARLPLRVTLMIFNCMALQNSIYEWTRDHRMHHKFTETDADPHNVKRGSFFSHMGWLMAKKHPDVKEKGKGIDLSDLRADRVVMFQKKYYKYLAIFWCFVFPTMAPVYVFGESWSNAFYICALLKYCTLLHFTWFVNSLAHLKGYKPYDRYMNASENLTVSVLALGEGWHNYHHVFPWDYKASELGKSFSNFTTKFINIFAKIGLAYDLKEVDLEIIKKRVQRTGDGTHHLWGWGDKDITKEDLDVTVVTNRVDELSY